MINKAIDAKDKRSEILQIYCMSIVIIDVEFIY